MIFILIGQLGIKQSVSSGASVKERGSEKCMALGFKESASRWDMKVVQETRVALQVYGVFLCPHSHLPNPHYISNTLILKQRHGFDYIGSEMPPGFQWSLSFSFFFSATIYTFFFFFPRYIWKSVSRETLSQWRAMPGSQKNVHICWVRSLKSPEPALSPSEGRNVKTIFFLQEPFPPKPTKFIRL